MCIVRASRRPSHRRRPIRSANTYHRAIMTIRKQKGGLDVYSVDMTENTETTKT